MPVECPYCSKENADRTKIVRRGFYYRTSDSKHVQRFGCRGCSRGFSRATFHPCFRQKKRHKNEILRRLLCSGVSQRRAARILGLHRITVVRKFLFLAIESKKIWQRGLAKTQTLKFEFDDLESFERSKCLPLSVTLAVESGTRRILGLAVARMPAKGLLAHKSRLLYGRRKDERRVKRRALFAELGELVHRDAAIKSDSNPFYAKDVREFFKTCTYTQYLGKRGALTGQGELKKVRFDPLFSLNHTCAKLRADINRLFRRTWCTTKRADRLEAHLHMYARYHNENL